MLRSNDWIFLYSCYSYKVVNTLKFGGNNKALAGGIWTQIIGPNLCQIKPYIATMWAVLSSYGVMCLSILSLFPAETVHFCSSRLSWAPAAVPMFMSQALFFMHWSCHFPTCSIGSCVEQWKVSPGLWGRVSGEPRVYLSVDSCGEELDCAFTWCCECHFVSYVHP